MRVTPEELKLFYELHPALLAFANERYEIIDGATTLAEVRRLPIQDLYRIKLALFDHPELMADFVERNPYGWARERLDIISDWRRHHLSGSFYLLKQLKKYAIFLSTDEDPKAYGVVALESRFDEIVPFMPIMMKVTLLPFRGKIIYDGLFSVRQIVFGRSMRESFNDSYNDAKARYGIIETLPPGQAEKEMSEEDRIRFYMKSASNRERFEDELRALIEKSEENRALYYQELGKYYAKQTKKSLRVMGVNSGWFAILVDTIVASGLSKQEAVSNAERMVPEERIPHVHYFRFKARK